LHNSNEEFDPSFVQDIRELKQSIANNKEIMEEYRQTVSRALTNALPDSSVSASSQGSNTMPFRRSFLARMDPSLQMSSGKDVYALFKTVLRNTLVLGNGLLQQKEVRDLFINLVEKILEPFVNAGWQVSEMELFFTTVIREWSSLESLSPSFTRRMAPSWERLLTGVQLSATRLFPASL
jgi:hypothetical protein